METYGLEQLGILNPKAVYRNLEPAQRRPVRADGKVHRPLSQR